MSDKRNTIKGILTALPAWWDALELMAKRSGVTRSEFVRRAVHYYVAAEMSKAKHYPAAKVEAALDTLVGGGK